MDWLELVEQNKRLAEMLRNREISEVEFIQKQKEAYHECAV